MFDDIIENVRALLAEIDIYSITLRDLIHNSISFIETAILEELIVRFVEAAESIPEYSNAHAAPLVERLVENLNTPDGEGFAHVRVFPDGNVFIFDEEVAGTESDFRSAEHHSRNNPDLRYIFWKYGIYVPDVEGGGIDTRNSWMRKAMENLPSYDDIIAERLATWGDKAPYWWFIENGNAGGGKPYPSFAGTHVVSRFRLEASKAVQIFLNDLVDRFEQEFLEATDQALTEGREVPVLDNNIRLERVSNNGHQQIIRRGTGGRFVRKLRTD